MKTPSKFIFRCKIDLMEPWASLNKIDWNRLIYPYNKNNGKLFWDRANYLTPWKL